MTPYDYPGTIPYSSLNMPSGKVIIKSAPKKEGTAVNIIEAAGAPTVVNEPTAAPAPVVEEPVPADVEETPVAAEEPTPVAEEAPKTTTKKKKTTKTSK